MPLYERAWQGPAGSKGAKPEEGHATVPGDDLPGITVIKEVAFAASRPSASLVVSWLWQAPAPLTRDRHLVSALPLSPRLTATSRRCVSGAFHVGEYEGLHAANPLGA